MLKLKIVLWEGMQQSKPSSPIIYTNVTPKELHRIKGNSINVKVGWKREKSFPKCFKIHGGCSQMDQDFHGFFYMTASHHATWAHSNIEIKRWSQILELQPVNAAEVQTWGWLLEHSYIMALAKFRSSNTLYFKEVWTIGDIKLYGLDLFILNM